MGIFLVTPIDQPELVIAAVKFIFPDDFYSIPKTNSWVVHFPGNAKELSDRLGLTANENGMTGIVVGLSDYSGKIPVDLEEWLQSKNALD
jgi:hypothetical protein